MRGHGSEPMQRDALDALSPPCATNSSHSANLIRLLAGCGILRCRKFDCLGCKS